MRKAVALAVLLTAAASSHAADVNINPEAIRAHMRFLADDLLEGRGTGTRGYAIAAAYVQSQFEALGLRASQQTVPFRKVVPQPESTVAIARGAAAPVELKFGDGFITYGSPFQTEATVEAPVVFVGHGITAPSQHYDDYAGIDARGKIVVFLTGGPESFGNEVRAHYSSSYEKSMNAARHGAVATITVYAPYEEKSYGWPRSVRGARLGGMLWVDAQGEPHGASRDIVAAVTLGRAGSEALFAGSPHTFAEVQQGNVKAYDLGARVRIHVLSTHSRVDSANVVGVLEGSDPKLKNEYVVYSAHLDHLGVGDPVDGDAINNGALDNASGIGAMLEVARAFAETKPRPRRSILFLATTGEEKGLRGADYFANNPTVPFASIVADINIDEILMFVPTRDVTQLGAEHSTLGEVLTKVGKKLGIEVSADPYPEEAGFVRSDQYPFVRRGIPSVYVGAGYKSIEPKRDAKGAQMNWVMTVYHGPKDDMSQTLDYTVGAQVARFDYEIGREVANADARPTWKPGDFFAPAAK